MRVLLLFLTFLSLAGAARGQDLRTGLPTPAPVPQPAAPPAPLAVSLTVVQVAALRLDAVAAADPDVVAAALAFAVLDTRYQEIASESYYGARLEAVHKRIAAEGLTPANKAEVLAIYQGAAAALRGFLAAHP